MNALLGQNLNLLLRTGEDSEVMDISGYIVDMDMSLPADGMMKTHLTLVNTQNEQPDGDWDLTRISNPGKVIVKCSHCGQWAAKKTACKYCGAPV